MNDDEMKIMQELTELVKVVSRLKGENVQLKERVVFLEGFIRAERQMERPNLGSKLIGE